MKIQYISKSLLAGMALTAVLVSCSEDKMDEINKDVNHTTDVPAKLIMTDVMTSTAFSVLSGDFNLYGGIYIEHETGSHNQFYNAEIRSGGPSSSSTFNNSWGSVYSTLKDAKIVIAKCSEGGAQEGNYVTKGAAEVLAAYNLAILTDMYGDTPWKEACDYTVSKTPAIDKQEEIYKDVFAYLDAAIEDLQKADIATMGAQDFIYAGDAGKWLKTAYGLKARYTMRLIGRSSDVKGDMQKVLDYASKSFASADEQCSYDMYKTGVNINPFFGVYWSRAGEVASRSMYDKLSERKDPRVRRCFIEPKTNTIVPTKDDKLFNLAKNGELLQSQQEYTTSIYVASQTAPSHILSYHEVLFLKAEALCRLEQKSEAKAALKAAVVAGMANSEMNIMAALNSTYWKGFKNVQEAITAEEAATYFDANVAPLFDANALKETMIQKYIAFWNANGESTECYNDVRRMKSMNADVYALQNTGKFPLRCPYGNDDTTTNPHVQEAYGDGQYVYSEPVWWAGGTR